MWHIILESSNGGKARVTEDNRPTTQDIEWWESYHNEHLPDFGPWITTNIFRTDDEE